MNKIQVENRAIEIIEGSPLTIEERIALALCARGYPIDSRKHPLWDVSNVLVEAGLLHNSGETTPEGDRRVAEGAA